MHDGETHCDKEVIIETWARPWDAPQYTRSPDYEPVVPESLKSERNADS